MLSIYINLGHRTSREGGNKPGAFSLGVTWASQYLIPVPPVSIFYWNTLPLQKCLSRYFLSCVIISGKHVLCMTWTGRRLLKCLAPSLIGSTLKSSHSSRLHARFLHHKNGIPSDITSQQKTSVIYVNQGFFGSGLPVHLHRHVRDYMQGAVKSFVQKRLNYSDETRHTRLGTTVSSRWALVHHGSAPSTVLWSIGSPTSAAWLTWSDTS